MLQMLRSFSKAPKIKEDTWIERVAFLKVLNTLGGDLAHERQRFVARVYKQPPRAPHGYASPATVHWLLVLPQQIEDRHQHFIA